MPEPDAAAALRTDWRTVPSRMTALERQVALLQKRTPSIFDPPNLDRLALLEERQRRQWMKILDLEAMVLRHEQQAGEREPASPAAPGWVELARSLRAMVYLMRRLDPGQWSELALAGMDDAERLLIRAGFPPMVDPGD